MIDYIKYCYRWVKVCGFVKSKTWIFSFEQVMNSNSDYLTEYFKSPIQFYKDKKEKELWIKAAKDLKIKIKNAGGEKYYHAGCSTKTYTVTKEKQ